MAGLHNSCDGFAYLIDAKEGGYVLNITNAVAILTSDKISGQVVFEVTRCPPVCPNLPYAEINVTMPIVEGTEHMIMRMQSSPNGDLWIRSRMTHIFAKGMTDTAGQYLHKSRAASKCRNSRQFHGVVPRHNRGIPH